MLLKGFAIIFTRYKWRLSAFVILLFLMTLPSLVPVQGGWSCFLLALSVIFLGVFFFFAPIADMSRMKKNWSNKELWVTHIGKNEVLEDKLRSGKLLPYPPVLSGWLQRLIGEAFVGIIDGKDPVTWVSLGKPGGGVRGLLAGDFLESLGNNALMFKVKAADIHMPKGLIKRFFVPYQLVIVEEFEIPSDVKVFERKSGKWKRVSASKKLSR